MLAWFEEFISRANLAIEFSEAKHLIASLNLLVGQFQRRLDLLGELGLETE